MTEVASWFSENIANSSPEVQLKIQRYFLQNFARKNFGELLAGIQNILVQSGSGARIPQEFLDELNQYDQATQDAIKLYILQNLMTKSLEEVLAGVQDILDAAEQK